MINERHFDSQADMFDALSADCLLNLQEALKLRSRASFIVSGGRTPIALFERLVSADLNWSSIDMALVDERWVNAQHERSNELLVNTHLLNALAAQGSALPTLTGLYHPSEHAGESVGLCNASYKDLAQPFDITVLGMGPDGHTASLFPHAEGLQQALDTQDLVTSIVAKPSAVTGDELERMTLTPHAIKQSKKVVLALTGADKLDVLKEALAGDDIAAMPVRAILLQNQVDVDVYWAP
jgi:6-phosphogluconolactonase